MHHNDIENVDDINKEESPSVSNNDSKHIVRLRGLPFRVTKHEISDFFTGLSILNGLNGINIDKLGQAHVQFKTKRDYQRSFSFHNKYLGDRYIEGKFFFFT